jgi:hypothetical protein
VGHSVFKTVNENGRSRSTILIQDARRLRQRLRANGIRFLESSSAASDRAVRRRSIGGLGLLGGVFYCLIKVVGNIRVGWDDSRYGCGLFVCFTNQPGNLDALLDALIQDKRDMGHVPGGQAIRNLGLDESGRTTEAVHG